MAAKQEIQIGKYGLVTPQILEKAGNNAQSLQKNPDEHEVNLCSQWLSLFSTPQKRINYYSSYGLKHNVEARAKEYIPSGALIEAAKRLGYEIIQTDHRSMNACFRLSYDRDAIGG